jgi:RsiW-degrading membrane proteinase PrsW (M82 family)
VSPALIYLFIILKSLSVKTINKQKITTGLTAGILSTTLVTFLQFIFPKYLSPITSNIAINVAFLAFIQISFVEEFFKYSTYKITGLDKGKFFPVETFVLCLLPSVSFAIIENLQYVSKFYYQGWDVALKRNLSATIMHIICGSMIGFGVVVGKLPLNKGKGFIDKLINKSKKIRSYFYTSIGILVATIIHGVYDLNLMAANMLPGYPKEEATEYTVAILIVYFLLLTYIIKNIKRLSNKTFS